MMNLGRRHQGIGRFPTCLFTTSGLDSHLVLWCKTVKSFAQWDQTLESGPNQNPAPSLEICIAQVGFSLMGWWYLGSYPTEINLSCELLRCMILVPGHLQLKFIQAHVFFWSSKWVFESIWTWYIRWAEQKGKAHKITAFLLQFLRQIC